jgi:hypothetical protein
VGRVSSDISARQKNNLQLSGTERHASELLELVKDRTWLVSVTSMLNQHWDRQNARKKNLLADVSAA